MDYILCVLLATVESENQFSTDGQICNAKRNQLVSVC